MSAEREREQERRLNLLDRRLRLAEDRIAETQQAIPRLQMGQSGAPSAPQSAYTAKLGSTIASSDGSTAAMGTAAVWDIDAGTGALSSSGSEPAVYNLQYGCADSTAGGSMPCGIRTDAAGKLVLVLPETFLGITAAIDAYPTTAASTYAIKPVRITSPETEGAGVTTSTLADVIVHAVNIGTSLPPVGTLVAVSSSFNRLFFNYK